MQPASWVALGSEGGSAVSFQGLDGLRDLAGEGMVILRECRGSALSGGGE